MNKLIGKFVTCLAGFVCIDASAGVFDDAAFWVRGFRDSDGNGLVAGGTDVPDARQANVTAGVTASGVASTRTWRKETVVCPYGGETFTAPCCYLNPTYDGSLYYCSSFSLSDATKISVTNGMGTVVARVRPELGLTDTSWLTGGIGFQLGFTKTSDGRLQLYGNYSRDSGSASGVSTDFTVEPGQWLDVAMTRDADSVHLYAATNGFTFSYAKSTLALTAVKTTFSFGNWQDTKPSGTSKTAYIDTFRGSIHQIAVWNRCLTEAEVREAFAGSRCDVFRAGVKNGSSDEFGLTDPSASAVSPSDWYEVPASLASGSTLQLAFTVPTRLAGMKQLLRVTPTASSDSGSMAVSVDGVALPVLSTSPGRTACCLIPVERMTAGVHTLTLARTTAGTTIFDVISLGGSVQLGIEDNSNAEYGIKAKGAPISSYLEDCNTTNSAQVIEQSTTNEWKIVLPADMPADCRWTYDVRAYTGKGMSTYTEPLRVALLVNGKIVKTDEFTERHQTFSVKLPAGTLQAGENILGFTNLMLPTQSGYYVQLDCVRLINRNVPRGMAIIVR